MYGMPSESVTTTPPFESIAIEIGSIPIGKVPPGPASERLSIPAYCPAKGVAALLPAPPLLELPPPQDDRTTVNTAETTTTTNVLIRIIFGLP